jgi:F-type H+-transporting ATPase subunit epsilon
MADQLQLEVVTRRRKVVDAAVTEVRLPGVLGELGVLPGHTPLLTALEVGRVAYTEGGKEHRLVVKHGFAEVQPDRVTVLAREAVLPQEIDREVQRQELSEATEALKGASAENLAEISHRLRSAEISLEITE